MSSAADFPLYDAPKQVFSIDYKSIHFPNKSDSGMGGWEILEPIIVSPQNNIWLVKKDRQSREIFLIRVQWDGRKAFELNLSKLTNELTFGSWFFSSLNILANGNIAIASNSGARSGKRHFYLEVSPQGAVEKFQPLDPPPHDWSTTEHILPSGEILFVSEPTDPKVVENIDETWKRQAYWSLYRFGQPEKKLGRTLARVDGDDCAIVQGGLIEQWHDDMLTTGSPKKVAFRYISPQGEMRPVQAVGFTEWTGSAIDTAPGRNYVVFGSGLELTYFDAADNVLYRIGENKAPWHWDRYPYKNAQGKTIEYDLSQEFQVGGGGHIAKPIGAVDKSGNVYMLGWAQDHVGLFEIKLNQDVAAARLAKLEAEHKKGK